MTNGHFVSGSEEPIVIRSLVVEHFRGFNDRMVIPLDASAVIVAGANGRGKTSLFDAIQWLTLGRIRRLEELRFRQNEEHIVNRYAPAGARASVQAEIVSRSSDRTVTVTRTGNYRNTVLEVSDGREVLVGESAESWLMQELGGSANSDVFERDFLTTALLQQDLVRSFLATSRPPERYETISRLLGLSIINDFVEQLEGTERGLRDVVARRSAELDEVNLEVSRVEQDVNETRVRIETIPVLTEAVKVLSERGIDLGLNPLVEPHISPEGIKLDFLERDLRNYMGRFRRLREVIDLIRTHLSSSPSPNAVELAASLNEILQNIEGESSQLEVERLALQEAQGVLDRTRLQADNLRQLAVSALPLLTNHCPVCEQQINTEEVRNRLEHLLSDQPDLVNATRAYEESQATVLSRERTIQQLQSAHNQTTSALRTAEGWQSHATSLMNQLGEFAESLSIFSFPQPLPQLFSVLEWLPTLENWAIEWQYQLSVFEPFISDAVAAQSIGQFENRLVVLNSSLQNSKARQTERKNALDQARTQLSERQKLIETARDTAVLVVESALEELEPAIEDLFFRLSPHPTFDRLSFSHDVYRRRGSSIPLAIDQKTNLNISPAVGFSSAQANVAALCYFIALAFASSEIDFNFVMLDDPLQSMDDVNVLGFSDLCRFLRKEKQLVISTHEDRLRNLLQRKLVARGEPLNTLVLNFTSWNRSGPYVEVERLELRAHEDILSILN